MSHTPTMIVQSPTVWDQTLNDLAETKAKLKAAEGKLAQFEKKMWEDSVVYQGLIQQIKNLDSIVERRDNIILLMKQQGYDYCQHVENLFSSGVHLDYEQLKSYCEVADYMLQRFGRTGSVLRLVEDHIKKMKPL